MASSSQVGIGVGVIVRHQGRVLLGRRLGLVAEPEVRRVDGGRPFTGFDGLSAFEAQLFAECWA